MANCYENPYDGPRGVWLRGNLHTHTTESDGELSPADTVRAYAELGYDFLAISDHDLLTDPEPLAADVGMALIRAEEVTAFGPHMLAVGISCLVAPDPERQRCINEISAAGGFSVLNHPNWGRRFVHFRHEMMEQLEGYLGIEIYNGVIEVLEGSPLALDRWDRLLSSGRRLWGFANDDTHWTNSIGRGWNCVQCTEATPAAILDALRAGRFYASTGVAIEVISLDASSLRIQAPNAHRIRLIGAHGRLLAQSDGSDAEFDVGGVSEPYLRVECLGCAGASAWTQPFYRTSVSSEA